MLTRAALLAAVVAAVAIGMAVPAQSSPGGGCYTASSGDCVPYPQQGGPQPQGATAQCADGSWSYSEHPYAGGTCHGHGASTSTFSCRRSPGYRQNRDDQSTRGGRPGIGKQSDSA